MKNSYIDRLNRSFADSVGYVPDRYCEGERKPQYMWVWTPTLMYTASDKRNDYAQFRLHDDDRWAVAKWQPPEPPSIWEAKYGKELPYQKNGMFVMTDFVLPPGEEPTERLTNWAIASIIEKRSMSFRQCLDAAQEQYDRNQRASRRQVDDLIDDACLTYDAVPGKRGGLRSFGGFEQTQNTERIN